MITQVKMPWSFIKFSQLILKGNVWRSVWRICMWILGLNGLSSKKHLLELSLSLDLMLVHSGNHLHCINVGGERWSEAKHCFFEQKSMMTLTLESTPIVLWSKSFTATPFLTCPLENKWTCMCTMHKNGIFIIFHNGLLKCRFVPYEKCMIVKLITQCTM